MFCIFFMVMKDLTWAYQSPHFDICFNSSMMLAYVLFPQASPIGYRDHMLACMHCLLKWNFIIFRSYCGKNINVNVVKPTFWDQIADVNSLKLYLRGLLFFPKRPRDLWCLQPTMAQASNYNLKYYKAFHLPHQTIMLWYLSL